MAGLAIALAAGAARGQERVDERQAQQEAREIEGPPASGEQAQAAGETSDAFERACVDLLRGRTPEGEKAVRALQDACRNLMAGRADERVQAEQRLRAQAQAREQLRLIAEGRAQGGEAGVEPGRSAGPVEPGEGVRAAFGQAASELTGKGPRAPMGMRQRGPVGYTLVTNPIGWFNGLGINAELFGAVERLPKVSWAVGGRFSQADASNGTASTFGAMGGVDLFVIGRNNEGFRIGPRIEVAAGREEFEGDTTFARMGLSGELGYNFIASNGLTGLVAGGLGGRVAGDEQNEDFASFVGGEFGPYLKLGLGFSW
jgi:hypothetical protein